MFPQSGFPFSTTDQEALRNLAANQNTQYQQAFLAAQLQQNPALLAAAQHQLQQQYLLQQLLAQQVQQQQQQQNPTSTGAVPQVSLPNNPLHNAAVLEVQNRILQQQNQNALLSTASILPGTSHIAASLQDVPRRPSLMSNLDSRPSMHNDPLSVDTMGNPERIDEEEEDEDEEGFSPYASADDGPDDEELKLLELEKKMLTSNLATLTKRRVELLKETQKEKEKVGGSGEGSSGDQPEEEVHVSVNFLPGFANEGLKLYRQLSKLAPERPMPIMDETQKLGLDLERKARIYAEPSDIPEVEKMTRDYEVFKPKLVDILRTRKMENKKMVQERRRVMSKTYREWSKACYDFESQPENVALYQKRRDTFETTFPELKAMKKEIDIRKERSQYFRTGINPEDAETMKIRESAVTVPEFSVFDPTDTAFFFNDNNLVLDAQGQARKNTEDFVSSWSVEEKKLFTEKIQEYGKNFSAIACFLRRHPTKHCVRWYYLSKKNINYKSAHRKNKKKASKVYKAPVMPSHADLLLVALPHAEKAAAGLSAAIESKCCMCNMKINVVNSVPQKRVVATRNLIEALGELTHGSDIKVCQRCQSEVKTNRNSTRCLTSACEVTKRKSIRLLPPKWKTAGDRIKKFIAHHFGFPREMTKCCQQCCKRITQKLDAALNNEIDGEIATWEFETAHDWPKAELNALDRVVKEKGQIWEAVSQVFSGRSAAECKTQWEKRNGVMGANLQPVGEKEEFEDGDEEARMDLDALGEAEDVLDEQKDEMQVKEEAGDENMDDNVSVELEPHAAPYQATPTSPDAEENPEAETAKEENGETSSPRNVETAEYEPEASTSMLPIVPNFVPIVPKLEPLDEGEQQGMQLQDTPPALAPLPVSMDPSAHPHSPAPSASLTGGDQARPDSKASSDDIMIVEEVSRSAFRQIGGDDSSGPSGLKGSITQGTPILRPPSEQLAGSSNQATPNQITADQQYQHLMKNEMLRQQLAFFQQAAGNSNLTQEQQLQQMQQFQNQIRMMPIEQQNQLLQQLHQNSQIQQQQQLMAQQLQASMFQQQVQQQQHMQQQQNVQQQQQRANPQIQAAQAQHQAAHSPGQTQPQPALDEAKLNELLNMSQAQLESCYNEVLNGCQQLNQQVQSLDQALRIQQNQLLYAQGQQKDHVHNAVLAIEHQLAEKRRQCQLEGDRLDQIRQLVQNLNQPPQIRAAALQALVSDQGKRSELAQYGENSLKQMKENVKLTQILDQAQRESDDAQRNIQQWQRSLAEIDEQLKNLKAEAFKAQSARDAYEKLKCQPEVDAHARKLEELQNRLRDVTALRQSNESKVNQAFQVLQVRQQQIHLLQTELQDATNSHGKVERLCNRVYDLVFVPMTHPTHEAARASAPAYRSQAVTPSMFSSASQMPGTSNQPLQQMQARAQPRPLSQTSQPGPSGSALVGNTEGREGEELRQAEADVLNAQHQLNVAREEANAYQAQVQEVFRIFESAVPAMDDVMRQTQRRNLAIIQQELSQKRQMVDNFQNLLNQAESKRNQLKERSTRAATSSQAAREAEEREKQAIAHYASIRSKGAVKDYTATQTSGPAPNQPQQAQNQVTGASGHNLLPHMASVRNNAKRGNSPVIGINKPVTAGGSLTYGRSAIAGSSDDGRLLDRVVHEEVSGNSAATGDGRMMRKSGLTTCVLPQVDSHKQLPAQVHRRTASPASTAFGQVAQNQQHQQQASQPAQNSGPPLGSSALMGQRGPFAPKATYSNTAPPPRTLETSQNNNALNIQTHHDSRMRHGHDSARNQGTSPGSAFSTPRGRNHGASVTRYEPLSPEPPGTQPIHRPPPTPSTGPQRETFSMLDFYDDDPLNPPRLDQNLPPGPLSPPPSFLRNNTVFNPAALPPPTYEPLSDEDN
ncbi:unnamed protein product, partial [Mesorhabditis spiculigera]